MGMTPLTHNEHEEFEKRIEAELCRLADEDKRQNKRIDKLEKDMDSLQAMATNVEKLAVNMGYMCDELKEQGQRLERLENRDGAKWREFCGYVGAAVTGAIISHFFKIFGG